MRHFIESEILQEQACGALSVLSDVRGSHARSQSTDLIRSGVCEAVVASMARYPSSHAIHASVSPISFMHIVSPHSGIVPPLDESLGE